MESPKIKLEKSGENKDRYFRLLRYVYLKEENINLKLIEHGFANIYFPSTKDKHYKKFKEAWEKCIEDRYYRGFCEHYGSLVSVDLPGMYRIQHRRR